MATEDELHAYYWACMKGMAPSLSPAEADIAKCGYWRTKDGAIAIWPIMDQQDGNVVKFAMGRKHNAYASWKTTEHQALPEVIGFAFAIPVTYDDFVHFCTEGVWLGQIPGLGHNTGRLSDYQEWKENVEGQIDDALRWLNKINRSTLSQTDADIAANYRDSLTRLSKKGELLLKEEKSPLEERLKETKKKWGDALAKADEVARTLREVVGVFLKAEESKEKQRIAMERRELEDQDIVMAALSEPEISRPKKVGAGGQLGRKTGLRTVRFAVITDYEQALMFFKGAPSIRSEVDRLCQAEARAPSRRAIPGVEYKEERKAV